MFRTAIVLAALLASPLHFHAAEAARPNIIIMMSDDMGFSDLGCYGGEIETPNLDALAADGLRFTQFYNTARCCPTRACLLSGLYPHQAGIGHMMEKHAELEGYQGDLNNRCVTIAEALKPAGYHTFAVGKWHVTPKTKPESDADKYNWPLQRGFDRFYGTIHGAGSFFDPNSLVRDNTLISPFADPEYQPKEFYYTDAIADHATRFIRENAAASDGKPFFMYVAFTAAHWPMHAKPADMAKYKGRYDEGYTAARAARLAKARSLGLLDGRWKLSPQAGEWDNVEDTDFETRCMEVYAAMVDCMDQGVGRIVAQLKDSGIYDNTLVMFLQDNGGCAEGMGRNSDGKPRADAPSLPPMAPDALQMDMIPKQTRDGYPMRQGYGVLPGGADTYIGYGEAWANVSNTPFREYKHWVHEGGISTPLIAHWPEGIKSKGGLCSQPAHLIDLMATCVDVSGASYPTEKKGQPITPMQGKSLRPAFQDETIERDAIYWEHEGNRAIRKGKWKLVAKGPKGAWELYDMEADRTEMHDVAAQHADLVNTLSAKWEAWARASNVIPWIWGPPYGEAKAGKAAGKKGAKKGEKK